MHSNPMLKDITFCVSEDIDVTNLPPHLLHFDFIPERSISTTSRPSRFCFLFNNKGLSLREIKHGQIMNEFLFIDFVHGKNGYRHAQNCTIKQPLAKAVGIRPGFRPAIFDATAGLGGDSFVLACLGCHVFLCERSPILYLLLQDALARAATEPKTCEIVKNNLHLMDNDSILALDDLAPPPHTIYLDPMYPHRTKSALNKKEMRVIRELVGDDGDSNILLEKALVAGSKRVVVKRPKGAPYIDDKKPSFEIKMKNSRFDIYLC